MIQPTMVNSAFVRPGFGDLPVGSVIAFAGTLNTPDSSVQNFTTAPLGAWGWMVCDGRTLAPQDYPELFAVLGYVYGGRDEQFHVPDYRGYFLRGNGNGTSNDPDLDSRSAPPGGQGLNNGVGSIQSSALENHEHNYNSAPAPATTSPDGTAAGAPSAVATLTTGGPVPGQGQGSKVAVSQSETRPINVSVNYIIKFTYGLRPFSH